MECFSFVIMLSAAAEVLPGPAAVDGGPSTSALTIDCDVDE
jgi:hypothetical protein